MKKHLLLLLMTLLGAVQTVSAQEIYAALDYTQQATIYYDDQKDVIEWSIGTVKEVAR